MIRRAEEMLGHDEKYREEGKNVIRKAEEKLGHDEKGGGDVRS